MKKAIVKKSPVPEPVVTKQICSICAEDWDEHPDDPTILDCVEILRAKRPEPVAGCCGHGHHCCYHWHYHWWSQPYYVQTSPTIAITPYTITYGDGTSFNTTTTSLTSLSVVT